MELLGRGWTNQIAWPVLAAGGGALAAGDKSSPTSCKTPRHRKVPDILYIVILQTHRGRCRAFLYTTSIYCDIVCNIGTILGPISVKNTISAMATYGLYTICTRYRAQYREKTRHRARYQKYRVWRLTVCTRYVHNIGPYIGKKHDIRHDIKTIRYGYLRCVHYMYTISGPILPVSGPIS